MALPKIAPYEMPTASSLPANRVSWTIEPHRAVLLIHDMQQYFVNAFNVQASPVTELLAHIGLLHKQCRALGIPVVYTAQPAGQTPEQRGLLFDFWGSGLNDHPHQVHIVPELAPLEGDIQLTKWRYSGFRKTELAEILKRSGRDQLMVTGVYAHIGCLMTACEAFMQDIQAFFVADAVADFSLENHRMALNYAAQRCAMTLTTQDVMGQLEAGSSAGFPEEKQPHERAQDVSLPYSRQALREQIAGLLFEAPESLGEDEDLIEVHGLDSIRVMSLVENWRRAGVEVSFVELAERPTIASWHELLASKVKITVPNLDY
ncbi:MULTISPECIES: isochorismatase [Paenibacillus]|uniref:isochorismatase n=1 Tax=Paenibacillus TaxID=44249 RepID=UPI0022B9096B|nr:isochorismatase [Paenibacillus caseinilyticus]MCZ8519580.1 isochorismatase [Paenibacillus caseinilyticus]